MTPHDLRPVARLEGSIRSYAWGSRDSIAAIRGRPHPTAEPEAELWFGAHPSSPSDLDTGAGPRPIDLVIDEDPMGMLGPPTVARFGPHLPFLLKVLAIEQPLSLQAHPSARQASAGFRVEQARGVPVDAPERTYRDMWPKPELLCALSDVDALAGFRDPAATTALLGELEVPGLRWLGDALATRGADALPRAVGRLLRWPADDRDALVASVVSRAGSAAVSDAHAPMADWIVRLGALHPADTGVVVAMLLNLVHLGPGDAIHLPAGNLHAYLRGTAVEVMAASDNVLRGGLTAKHVDVDGLLHVLDPRPLPAPRVPSVMVPGGRAYPTATEHFALQRLVPGELGIELVPRGPEILLAVGGSATVTADGVMLPLGSGEAAFVRADAPAVRLAGEATVFRATVGGTAAI